MEEVYTNFVVTANVTADYEIEFDQDITRTEAFKWFLDNMPEGVTFIDGVLSVEGI